MSVIIVLNFIVGMFLSMKVFQDLFDVSGTNGFWIILSFNSKINCFDLQILTYRFGNGGLMVH